MDPGAPRKGDVISPSLHRGPRELDPLLPGWPRREDRLEARRRRSARVPALDPNQWQAPSPHRRPDRAASRVLLRPGRPTPYSPEEQWHGPPWPVLRERFEVESLSVWCSPASWSVPDVAAAATGLDACAHLLQRSAIPLQSNTAWAPEHCRTGVYPKTTPRPELEGDRGEQIGAGGQADD